MADLQLSTGLPGFDRLLKGLIPGDNLVWQVDTIEDFIPFVVPYVSRALASGRKVVYFRFAEHAPLAPAELPVAICRLQTDSGFEQFITEIHRKVSEAGRGAYFLFDCLSTLAEDWLSDRMLGNFFMLTCPYVYDLESLAYFPLLRNVHSFHAIGPIGETTQIFIDVYRHKGGLYVHPTKVQHRYSPTMYMLHEWEGEEFTPVTESSTIAEILTSMPWAGLDSVRLRQGLWNRNFLRAEEIWEGVRRGARPPQDAAECLQSPLRMIVSRDPRVLALAEKYLDLGDVLNIWKRLIGTGLIGGKSVGMLLARAILHKTDPRWDDVLESHDSFFIGSDVFYSFLVENGCWWLRQKQHDHEHFLEGVEEVRRRILMGNFPNHIVQEFSEMLAYFGQSPIIVRSSSLLEDNYGNAFAGKYESVFCANQGPHQKRLADFISAVRTIYASTMSEKALHYRAQRGLLDSDEQMSLLVQRVSGARYGSFFFPQVAGVGYSLNPYVWSRYIDPKAGMMRLVFGLGTRAVDRSDDDYTRVVALNDPQRRPESDADEVRQYSQRKVDVIDLDANQVVSLDVGDVLRQCRKLLVQMFATADMDLARMAAARNLPETSAMVLTFQQLLEQTTFVGDFRKILETLGTAYGSPVDLEFTANFFAKDQYKINLLQCRPLQVAFGAEIAALPTSIRQNDLILEASGAVIGQSRTCEIDRIVYVTPSQYSELPIGERYELARLIGKVLMQDNSNPPRRIMLIGPGRWGTKSPSLGVPVSFTEIDRVAVLCEIVAMREDLIPDVSLGTHFFNDLVEMDILYLALFPGRRNNQYNRRFLEETPSQLAELIPNAATWSNVLRVIDMPQSDGDRRVLRMHADTAEQKVVCYLAAESDSSPGGWAN
jgi:pyruvate,water dikinase